MLDRPWWEFLPSVRVSSTALPPPFIRLCLLFKSLLLVRVSGTRRAGGGQVHPRSSPFRAMYSNNSASIWNRQTHPSHSKKNRRALGLRSRFPPVKVYLRRCFGKIGSRPRRTFVGLLHCFRRISSAEIHFWKQAFFWLVGERKLKEGEESYATKYYSGATMARQNFVV